MKNKVSNIQMGMFFILICASMYLGLSDIILIRKAHNEVLISMLLGSFIGLIPVLIYLKINNKYPNLNIYQKNNALFSKYVSLVINVAIFLFYIVMFTISIRATVIFITSKYLQNTPFYLVGILTLLTTITICIGGLKTIARVSQINFILSIILMFLIEILLLKYIQIDNILPIIINKKHIYGIIDGAIYQASSTGFLSFLLLSINKNKIDNNEKYNKTIIISYFIVSILLILVTFFVISCFGYNMATLFRYPEYILLKKIGITNSGLHIENLLAFRWLFYILALSNISLYGIKCAINLLVSNKRKFNFLIIIICLICMIAAKVLFGNTPYSILGIQKYFVSFFALPIFIIMLIIFIKCLLKKDDGKNV